LNKASNWNAAELVGRTPDPRIGVKFSKREDHTIRL